MSVTFQPEDVQTGKPDAGRGCAVGLVNARPQAGETSHLIAELLHVGHLERAAVCRELLCAQGGQVQGCLQLAPPRHTPQLPLGSKQGA